MKVSVVVTTYQGEKYIVEQLASIRNQTKQPDEVVISDDNSSDSTEKIILKFIDENNLSNWFFIKNTENKGWKKNFKDTLEIASGDIIFLCDQDDIWIETKIEEMVSIFDRCEKMELLVSGYEVFRDFPPENTRDSGIVRKVKFDRKFIHNRYPGCVYCFRKELFDEVSAFWNVELPHDQQLWLFANIRDSLYVYNKPLIFYRRHSETTTGRDGLNRKSKLRNIKYECLGIESVLEYIKQYPISYKKESIVLSTKKYIFNRVDFLKKRKFQRIFSTFKYLPYYFSIKTFFGDIYINFFK